jgi:hypothetical protein
LGDVTVIQGAIVNDKFKIPTLNSSRYVQNADPVTGSREFHLSMEKKTSITNLMTDSLISISDVVIIDNYTWRSAAKERMDETYSRQPSQSIVGTIVCNKKKS